MNNNNLNNAQTDNIFKNKQNDLNSEFTYNDQYTNLIQLNNDYTLNYIYSIIVNINYNNNLFVLFNKKSIAVYENNIFKIYTDNKEFKKIYDLEVCYHNNNSFKIIKLTYNFQDYIVQINYYSNLIIVIKPHNDFEIVTINLDNNIDSNLIYKNYIDLNYVNEFINNKPDEELYNFGIINNNYNIDKLFPKNFTYKYFDNFLLNSNRLNNKTIVKDNKILYSKNNKDGLFVITLTSYLLCNNIYLNSINLVNLDNNSVVNNIKIFNKKVTSIDIIYDSKSVVKSCNNFNKSNLKYKYNISEYEFVYKYKFCLTYHNNDLRNSFKFNNTILVTGMFEFSNIFELENETTINNKNIHNYKRFNNSISNIKFLNESTVVITLDNNNIDIYIIDFNTLDIITVIEYESPLELSTIMKNNINKFDLIYFIDKDNNLQLFKYFQNNIEWMLSIFFENKEILFIDCVYNKDKNNDFSNKNYNSLNLNFYIYSFDKVEKNYKLSVYSI